MQNETISVPVELQATLKVVNDWRLKLIQFIVGLAYLLGGVAMLPVETVPVPEHWRPYLLSVALFCGAAGKWLVPLLDLLDNGKIDGSFKMEDPLKKTALMLICVATFALTSCAEMAGAGRVRIQWTSPDGVGVGLDSKSGLIVKHNRQPRKREIHADK